MGNRGTRFTVKETVESQLEKKSSSKSQESSSMSEEQKLRKYVGVGYAGRVAKAAFVGIAALTTGASADAHAGTALAHWDSGNAMALHPGLDQGFSNLSKQTESGTLTWPWQGDTGAA